MSPLTENVKFSGPSLDLATDQPVVLVDAAREVKDRAPESRSPIAVAGRPPQSALWSVPRCSPDSCRSNPRVPQAKQEVPAVRRPKELPRFEIDRVIHEPARLLLMAHLYVVESADAVFLMQSTDLTWGNLSSHLAKLEEAGYVETVKDFVGRKPHTMVRPTAAARSTRTAGR
jgi:DNA-binding transcriptional ArsR family regulator